jgi:predicted DNA-binding transcriptional regulator AlpA
MTQINSPSLNEPPSAGENQHVQRLQPVKTSSGITPALTKFDSLPDSAHVRLNEVTQLFGCSRASVWRWTKANKLPAPKRFGNRVSAWNVGDLRIALGIRR